MKSKILILIVLLSMSACTRTPSDTPSDNEQAIQAAVDATVAAQIGVGDPEVELPTEVSGSDNNPTSDESNELEAVTTEPSNRISTPNLELYAQEILTEPLENGLKRLTVGLVAKNASNGWSSYFIDTYAVGVGIVECDWEIYPQQSRPQPVPILLTEEGYEYSPITNRNMNCGPRNVYDMPPGMAVSAFLNNFGNQTPFGLIQFDIAEGMTPISIKIPIMETGLLREAAGQQNYREVLVDLQSTFPGPFLDNSYAEQLGQGGEFIELGDDFGIIVGNFEIINESTTSIPIEVVNNNPAYSLDFFMRGKLVNKDGVICCEGINVSKGEATVGPGQTATLTLEIETLANSGSKYWLFGPYIATLNSPDQVSNEGNYVVEVESE